MPIAPSNILFKHSTKSGSAGNTTAGTPAGSLGRFISTTEITDATLGNLFDDVTGDQNAALASEFRCLFVHNTHLTLTLQYAVVWVPSQVAGGAVVELALDNIGVTPVGSSSDQASSIANSDVPPGGVTSFVSATSKATGLLIGNIPPGHCAAVWVKRTATNSAAQTNDGATIRVSGDTAA